MDDPMTTAIERFLLDRTLKRRSPATIARYQTALRAWQHWRTQQGYVADLAQVSLAELRRYLLYLLLEQIPHSSNPRRPAATHIGMSPNAVRSARNIIRALLLFFVDEQVLSNEWREWLKNSRLPAPEIELLDRPYWDGHLVDALCAAAHTADSPEVAARTVAVVRLIYESGVRLDELCRMQDADLNLDERCARIMGKGRKRRWVYWGDAAAAALATYLAVRGGSASGPVPWNAGSAAEHTRCSVASRAFHAQVRSWCDVAPAPKGAIQSVCCSGAWGCQNIGASFGLTNETTRRKTTQSLAVICCRVQRRHGQALCCRSHSEQREG